MDSYAVIRTGGKQYRVTPGQQITIEKIDGARGEKVVFGEVLMLGGEQTVVGTPLVDGVTVQATVWEQTRDNKIMIHKHKRRKNYRKSQGHRQWITRVRIEAIDGAGAA